MIEDTIDLERIRKALLDTYASLVSSSEQDAAFKDIIRTIKHEYGIIDSYYDNDEEEFVLSISEKGLNKLFIAMFLPDDRAYYNAPDYGWSSDFNYDYFIEELEAHLDN